MENTLVSKKFIAFIVTQLGFFSLMITMVLLEEINTLGGNAAFISLVLSSAFLAVGYVLGQASLDRFVRVAKIAANMPKKLKEQSEEDPLPEDDHS